MNRTSFSTDSGSEAADRAAPAAKEPPSLAELPHWTKGLLRRLGIGGAEEASAENLQELIETHEDRNGGLSDNERVLVHNILRLRHRSVADLMIPRADIVAIDDQASLADVTDLMMQCGHSRIPVYRGTLDDVLGMVHIKDVVAWRGRSDDFQLTKVLRPLLFVAPSMEVLPLLLEMRAKRSHMAVVVDEYGGVDGLVTIEDVVEEIVGEIADEHERDEELTVMRLADGSLDADARAAVESLDDHFGAIITAEEREEVDTIGGLVISLVGRVPIRGELIRHPGGLEFEVLDADPRRIRRLRIRRVSVPADKAGATKQSPL